MSNKKKSAYQSISSINQSIATHPCSLAELVPRFPTWFSCILLSLVRRIVPADIPPGPAFLRISEILSYSHSALYWGSRHRSNKLRSGWQYWILLEVLTESEQKDSDEEAFLPSWRWPERLRRLLLKRARCLLYLFGDAISTLYSFGLGTLSPSEDGCEETIPSQQ